MSETPGPDGQPLFRHSIKVRYGECDMQGVVFNPNYWVYVDDVVDQWLIATLGREWNQRFDCVVKKATMEWHAAAHHGDTVEFALSVSRWGSTSFDVRLSATVAGQPVITAEVVYISVEPGTHSPCRVSPSIRAELSRPVA